MRDMESTLRHIPQIDPEKLRDARERAGLSQTDIGRILGVGKSQIANIESGYSKLEADYLPLWAAACNVRNVMTLYTTAPRNAFFTRRKTLEKSST